MRVIAVICFVLLLIFIFYFFFRPDFGIKGDSIDDLSLSEALEKNTEHNDTTLVVITTKGLQMSYSITEIKAKAGDILRIQYINEGDMSHNIVLVREEADIRPVGVAALEAMSNDWIPEKEMDRIIAYSKLAYPGETVEFSFKVPPPGTYPYICTYSAHWKHMQGRLISIK
jgi:plastocyanin